ncbi:hypothetical protein LTR56_004700 [Elasticomyces elasticus]|nr:hypothetical protein LTR56_004700 [Elasticomyces elasticus]KAK3665555.1 hypothetical protein LTR22_003495 [Elasticomyces elasticus]KAK4930407.1 hypothetical protein LTR49_003148 [Elasticomyces elasticus]KAK5768866.1 hypothetical protein LTS12_000926 [Elasticomyces elasticus]
MLSGTAYFALIFVLSACQGAAAWWQPSSNTTWQIVLSHVLTPPTNISVLALDGDLFDNASNGSWPTIKAAGYRTICYFSAGSYEDWRPDAQDFLPADLGEPLDGWPGEKWLNTNSLNVRKIMQARLDLAVKQGCDAVDPDNIDAYDNDGGGLNLTTADAVSYVRFLAIEAHNRDLAMGLKNGGSIVGDVLNVTDFEVNEQCVQYDECETFQPFVDAGKPVFGIEYTKADDDTPTRESSFVNDICANPSRRGFSTLIKHMNLDEWVVACDDAENATSDMSIPASTSAAPTKASSMFGVGVSGIVVAGAVTALQNCWSSTVE